MAIINGTAANDTLAGTAGDDSLQGGMGNDLIQGGDGNDTAVYTGSVRNYIFGRDASGNLTITDTSLATAEGRDTLTGVETLQFYDTSMTFKLRGLGDYSTTSNWLTAGSGEDWLSLFGNGPVIFDGGDGNDRLIGTYQDGHDLLAGGAGDDTILTWGGDDVVFGGAGQDRFELTLSDSATTMTGGAGTDTYAITNWQNAVGQGPIIGTEKVITDFAAGDGGDIIDMQSLLWAVLGYTGEGFGSSALALVQEGGDVLVKADIDGGLGTRGFETVYRLQGISLGALTAHNFGGYDPAGAPQTPRTTTATDMFSDLFGFGGNDTLTGDARRNMIVGGDGRDSLIGLDGNDYLSGDLGFDSLYGGAGADELYDSYGANLFDGGAGADTISAYGGAATILGGSGDDSIGAYAQLGNLVDAGDGDDVVNVERGLVTLGTGRDIVGMNSLPTGPVVITDFQAGAGGDMLNLTGLGAFFGYTGSDPFADGYLSWTQDGADAVLNIAGRDASGTEVMTVLLTLQNVDAADVVRDNFVHLAPTADDDTLIGVWGRPLDGGLGDDLLIGTGAAVYLPGGLLLSGGDGNDTLKGSAGDDVLDGGFGSDEMWGGTGNDRYRVQSAGDVVHEDFSEYGADTVEAWISYTLPDNVEALSLNGYLLTGQGNALDNTIYAGGSARLLGGDGSDVLYGRGGNDTLRGEAGIDGLYGGAGNDDLLDLQGRSYLRGEAGNDTVVGRGYLTGDEGDDVLTADATNATSAELTEVTTLQGWEGNDVITSRGVRIVAEGFIGNDTLTGDIGADSLDGGDGNDWLTGGARWDTLRGGDGDDTLDGGLDNDQMHGGTGNDLYYVDNIGDRTYELLNEGNDSVIASISWALAADVENLTLTGTALTGTGNGLSNRIIGNELANTLSGGASADTLDGGAGADSLDGGIGNDSLLGGARWDTLIGGDGNDTLDGGADNDVMYGGFGDDVYSVDHVGDRVNEATGENQGFDTVFASISWNMTANIETVVFSGSADATSTGNSLHNTMTGNAGNNTLSGGTGHDTINGGDGNDSLDGGLDSDLVDGGNGNDTILGGQRWDTLNGGSGDDVIDGGTENDRMIGGAGNDIYYMDHVGDRVIELAGEGIDTVYSTIDWAMAAEVENLVLMAAATTATGNGLANRITGNDSANLLSGGHGNDTLTGGAGADTLTGGTGRDDFVFNPAGTNGTDRIADFAHAIDRLVFKGSDYGFASGHVLTNAQFTAGASAVGTGAQFIWDAATGHLWWDADGTGAGAKIDLAGFDGAPGLTKEDMYFIA